MEFYTYFKRKSAEFSKHSSFKNFCIKLYLLVVMRTTGYGPAIAPSGWEEHQGYPAKRWEEAEKKRRESNGAVGYLLLCALINTRNSQWKAAPFENFQRG